MQLPEPEEELGVAASALCESNSNLKFKENPGIRKRFFKLKFKIVKVGKFKSKIKQRLIVPLNKSFLFNLSIKKSSF